MCIELRFGRNIGLPSYMTKQQCDKQRGQQKNSLTFFTVRYNKNSFTLLYRISLIRSYTIRLQN